jgi:hypothetical protein
MGLNWGSQNIVAGDLADGQIWDIDPISRVDGGGYPITSEVIGYFPFRGLGAQSCGVILTTSVGDPGDGTGECTVTLETSDDEGASYTSHEAITVIEGDYTQPRWLGIGQIEAPGRVFKITDIGAFTRIDSLDMPDG